MTAPDSSFPIPGADGGTKRRCKCGDPTCILYREDVVCPDCEARAIAEANDPDFEGRAGDMGEGHDGACRHGEVLPPRSAPLPAEPEASAPTTEITPAMLGSMLDNIRAGGRAPTITINPVDSSADSSPAAPRAVETAAEVDFAESMDAQVWARAFVARARKNPTFATDESTMISWFASAIMRGWDGHAKKVRDLQDQLDVMTAEVAASRASLPPAADGETKEDDFVSSQMSAPSEAEAERIADGLRENYGIVYVARLPLSIQDEMEEEGWCVFYGNRLRATSPASPKETDRGN